MRFKEGNTNKAMDVHKEYKSIFGEEQRSTLYDSDDEYYKDFRKKIVSSPIETYDKSKLPFGGVTLIAQIDTTTFLSTENNTTKQNATSFGIIDEDLSNAISNLVFSLDNQVCQTINSIIESLLSNCHYKQTIGNNFKQAEINFEFPPLKEECSQQKLFYIKKIYSKFRHCDAQGVYNTKTCKFTIKKGSVFCLESVRSYENTSGGIKRKIIMNHFCIKETNGYRLAQDYECDTPSAAAALCIGRGADGWTEWKDVEGRPLILSIKI